MNAKTRHKPSVTNQVPVISQLGLSILNKARIKIMRGGTRGKRNRRAIIASRDHARKG